MVQRSLFEAGSALPNGLLHLPEFIDEPTEAALIEGIRTLDLREAQYKEFTAKRRVGTSKIKVLRDGPKFLLIILKIVTLYSPLKVFFPISLVSLLLGVAYGLWNVWVWGKIPMGAGLLIQLAVVVFLFGLISEQISAGQERSSGSCKPIS